jgi:RHS repeat-associated protein
LSNLVVRIFKLTSEVFFIEWEALKEKRCRNNCVGCMTVEIRCGGFLADGVDGCHDVLRVEVKDYGVSVTKFAYDAGNRAIIKESGGNQIQLQYLGWQLLSEADHFGVVMKRFVYGRYLDDPILLVDSSGSRFGLYKDGAGNVTALTFADGVGEPMEYYEYDWFGLPNVFDDTFNPVGNLSLYGNSFMFHSRRWRAQIGLYYFRNRYYDPIAGRFTSNDPNPNGYNWAHGQGNGYSAFGGDGWNRRDPCGLEEYWIGGAADKTKEFGVPPTKLMENLMIYKGGQTPNPVHYYGHQDAGSCPKSR